MSRKLEDLEHFSVCGGEMDCGEVGVGGDDETYPLDGSDFNGKLTGEALPEWSEALTLDTSSTLSDMVSQNFGALEKKKLTNFRKI